MSLLARIGRALQAPRRSEPDEATAYGMAGEALALDLMDRDGYFAVHNRIVPHPEQSRRFLEADAIIYAEGSLFCVEVKRYRGTLGWLDDGGKRRLLQLKPGNYGEGVFEQTHPDPLGKTKFYIHCLKDHLSGVDERFSRLYFRPLVAFVTEDCEISGVRDFDAGYVGLGELAAFVSYNRNERFAERKSRWIVDGLSELAGWDRLITAGGAEHYGILGGRLLTLQDGSGCKRSVRYDETRELAVKSGGRFSAADAVELTGSGGEKVDLLSSFGSVSLDEFGSVRKHRLKDLRRVIVGTQRLRASRVESFG